MSIHRMRHGIETKFTQVALADETASRVSNPPVDNRPERIGPIERPGSPGIGAPSDWAMDVYVLCKHLRPFPYAFPPTDPRGIKNHQLLDQQPRQHPYNTNRLLWGWHHPKE